MIVYLRHLNFIFIHQFLQFFSIRFLNLKKIYRLISFFILLLYFIKLYLFFNIILHISEWIIESIRIFFNPIFKIFNLVVCLLWTHFILNLSHNIIKIFLFISYCFKFSSKINSFEIFFFFSFEIFFYIKLYILLLAFYLWLIFIFALILITILDYITIIWLLIL